MKLIRTIAACLLLLALGASSIEAHPKTVRISVTKNGFSPASINTETGSPLTLIFTRRSRQGCGNKVVFSSLGITKDLPVGRAVTIKFTPRKDGTINFTCGMGMYKGVVLAEEG